MCAQGTTCSALIFDKDGKVTNGAGAGAGWMFEAADGLMAMIPVKDDDYVSYGFWLTKDDKEMPTGFNVFYNGEGGVYRCRDFAGQTNG